jgi:two-component system chemotaxis response regulator CheY
MSAMTALQLAYPQGKQNMKFEDLSVLVIDDSSFIRDIIKKILHGYGVSDIREASDGIDGLQMVSGYHTDLIVCDLSMEPMNGFSFVESLRALEDVELSETPVIILTMHDEKDFVEKASKTKINGYILKPVSSAMLKNRIIQVMTKAGVELSG